PSRERHRTTDRRWNRCYFAYASTTRTLRYRMAGRNPVRGTSRTRHPAATGFAWGLWRHPQATARRPFMRGLNGTTGIRRGEKVRQRTWRDFDTCGPVAVTRDPGDPH